MAVRWAGARSFFSHRKAPGRAQSRALHTGRDAEMPTPLSLGSNLMYHAAPGSKPHIFSPHGARRPLVLIAGWMGAKARQLKPYLRFYHDRGFDTLSFAVGPQHVLFPDQATAQMRRVLDHCLAPAASETRPLTSLTFHMFSVGGFCYGQMLRILAEEDRYNEVPRMISAQIFDSPPDIKGIARGAFLCAQAKPRLATGMSLWVSEHCSRHCPILAGVSRSMGVGEPLSTAVEYGLSGYLALTANTAVGRGHEAASAAFHGNSLSAPSLWYYSKADLVADWQRIEAVQDKWRSRGTSIEQCRWDDSPHIQHGRVDPERYFDTLAGFLQRHKLA